MASIAKLFSAFFLLTLLSSLQTHARDSQFFSKVTRENTNPNNENNYYNTNPNVQEQAAAVTKVQEQEPAFIPQTTQTGYGLYGHETGQSVPSTTTTTRKPSYSTTYKTQFEEPRNNAYGTKNFNGNNKYVYNVDAFDSKEEGSTKETQNGYYFNTKTNTKNYEERNYSPELQGLSGTSYQNGNKYNYNYNNNVEKQGMSDTRFLENGRYFYDLNTEKNVPNFGSQNSGRNEYFPTNKNNYVNGGFYGNNVNFNSNEQYKNEKQAFENQEDEFEFEP
ncbi:hypothetical protein Ancab_033876 [Ancistrocladus abbreviatus]